MLNQKKQRMIEESMKLFAEKGFHATSIQEIANKSDVSKGTFYLYFASKEELIVELFDYYTSLVMDKFKTIQQKNIDAKQKLVEQMQMMLDLITNHKEYMVMHLQDNIHIGQHMNDLAMKLLQRSFEWSKTALTEIYGEQIEPYIVDASIQLDGALHGYCKAIVMHDLQVDNTSLARFIVDRLDDTFSSMMQNNVEPQISYDQLTFATINQSQNVRVIKKLIERTIATIDLLQLPEQEKKQLKEAAEMINEESNKPEANNVVLQGILLQLKRIPELQKLSSDIATELGV